MRGFTLVELMVVMVVGSVLLAIAIPTYQTSVIKSRRTEAKTALLELQGREERYSAIANAYTTDPTLLGYAAGGSGATFPLVYGSGNYSISVALIAGTATTPSGYALTATPVGGTSQSKDSECQTFTLTSNGQQTSTSGSGTATTDCW